MGFNDSMIALANTIRAKAGVAGKLTITGMISAVNSIVTGETGDLTPLINRTISTTVHIPASATLVGPYAFYSCTNLSSAVIEHGVANISHCAFASTSLKNIAIPSSVLSVHSGAFEGCAQLSRVSMYLNTVAHSSAFDANVNKTLYLSGTPTYSSIGDWKYSSVQWLNGINTDSNITSIGTGAFYYCSLSSAVLSNVSYIGPNAFEECNRLKYISMPDGVTNIPSACFRYCDTFSRVSLGANVTTIGREAFAYTKLKSVNFVSSEDEDYASAIFSSGLMTIEQGAFYNCPMDMVYLPVTVTTIGPSAFASNSLIEINFPENITSIGNDAFSSCGRLLSVSTPDGVTYGGGAFRNCNVLIEAQVGSTVMIANHMFYACPKLSSVILPNNLTTIGSEAFRHCTLLSSIAIPNTVENISPFAFANCGLSAFTLPAGVKIISSGVFCGCSNLSTIHVDYASRIDYAAFHSCVAVSSAYLGASVTSINSGAFGNVPALEYISCGFRSGAVEGAPWGVNNPGLRIEYAD